MSAPKNPKRKDRSPPPLSGTAQERAERLKAALKVNIARRKAQARARAGGGTGDGQGEDGGGQSG
jgi:hypothetical protein